MLIKFVKFESVDTISNMDGLPTEILFMVYGWLSLLSQYRLARTAKRLRNTIGVYNGNRVIRTGHRHHDQFRVVYQLGPGGEIDGRYELYRRSRGDWTLRACAAFQRGILRSIHHYSPWERLSGVWSFNQRGWLVEVVLGMASNHREHLQIRGLVAGKFTNDTTTILHDNHGAPYTYKGVPPGRYLTSQVSDYVFCHSLLENPSRLLFEFYRVAMKAPEHVFYPHQVHLDYYS